MAGTCECGNELSGFVKSVRFLDQLRNCQLLRKDATAWSWNQVVVRVLCEANANIPWKHEVSLNSTRHFRSCLTETKRVSLSKRNILMLVTNFIIVSHATNQKNVHNKLFKTICFEVKICK